MIAAFFLLLGFGGGVVVSELSGGDEWALLPECVSHEPVTVLDGTDGLWSDLIAEGVMRARLDAPGKLCAAGGICGGHVVPVIFATLPRDTRGRMVQRVKGGQCLMTIQLNKEGWAGYTDAQKVETVRHEVLHAVGLNHQAIRK